MMENAHIVSIQEAIFLVLHLPLRLSSRKTVFINTRSPNERTRLLRKERILNQNTTDITIEPDSFCPNIFDRYLQRPAELENLSLYEFGSTWEIDYRRTKAADRESDDEFADPDEAPFLENNNGPDIEKDILLLGYLV